MLKSIVEGLNLNHYYNDVILGIIPKILELISVQPDEIWLFGSCARSSIKSGSDVDIILLYDDHEVARRMRADAICLADIDEYSWSLSPRGFIEVDLVIRSRQEIDSKDFVFNRVVKKDKVVLFNKE